MRVLVTGADGFVGEHLLRGLLERGYDVVGAIRGATPDHRLLSAQERSAVRWLSFDLLDAGSIRRVVRESRPEAVVHLAALSSVARSWKRPDETLAVNLTGTLHLLLALREERAPPRTLLLVGSSEVYGRDAEPGRPLREEMAPLPRSPYAATKAAQEMLGLGLWAQAESRLIATRSFPHTGPGQRPPFVLPQWAAALLEIRSRTRRGPLRVGDVEVVRDYTDVRDVADAYMRLLEAPSARGVYNVCSGRGRRLGDLLAELQGILGTSAAIEPDPTLFRPNEIRMLVGDPGRLRELGWSPRYTLEETLSGLVASLQDALPTREIGGN